MDKKIVHCPNCTQPINVSELIFEEIAAGVKADVVTQQSAQMEQKVGEIKGQYSSQMQQQKQDFAQQMQRLQSQLQEQQGKVSQAQDNELKLREQARQLQQRQQEMDLEVARKLDAERKKINLEARQHVQADFALKQQQSEQQHLLKLQEKEQQIQGLRDSLLDAKRKSEQGSQEAQGEALELSLEASLRQAYPQDEIVAVAKGVRGADVQQVVRNGAMQECGSVLWELKNTKAWSQAWVQKLKDDMRAAKAQFAILVTVAMPPNMQHFGLLEGVWVCDLQSYKGLITALRQQLIEVDFVKQASQGQQSKSEVVYDYLMSDAFRSKIEAIVESFNAMEMQLIRERRALEKQWKEREQLINRMMTNTVGMYGEIKGIVGQTLPEIKQLELDDEDE